MRTPFTHANWGRSHCCHSSPSWVLFWREEGCLGAPAHDDYSLKETPPDPASSEYQESKVNVLLSEDKKTPPPPSLSLKAATTWSNTIKFDADIKWRNLNYFLLITWSIWISPAQSFFSPTGGFWFFPPSPNILNNFSLYNQLFCSVKGCAMLRWCR